MFLEKTPIYIYKNGKHEGAFLDLVSILEDYETLSYTKGWHAPGSFSITLNYQTARAPDLIVGRVLRFGEDNTKNGIIQSVKKDLAKDGTTTLTVSGQEYWSLLGRRPIIPPSGQAYFTTLNSTPIETGIKTLISQNCGSTAITKRKINSINVLTDQARGSAYKFSERLNNLIELCSKALLATNSGFVGTLNHTTKKYDLEWSSGTDRSSTVIISTDFDTAQTAKLDENDTGYRNVIIIAGQGEGVDRNIRVVYQGDEPEDLDRREMFQDARDLSSDDSLDQRAAQKLAENSYTKFIEVSPLIYTNVRYERDYFVGDKVTFRQFGVTQTMFITSATETLKKGEYTLTLGVDRAPATVSGQIQSMNGLAVQTLATIEPTLSTGTGLLVRQNNPTLIDPITDDLTVTDLSGNVSNTIQNDISTRGSSGVLDGSLVYVTQQDSTHINVLGGSGYLRTTNDEQGNLVKISWTASNNIEIPAGSGGVDTVRFVGIEYNSGSPRVTVRSTFDWNWYSDFPLGRISQDGTSLRILNSYGHAQDTASKTRRFLRLTQPFKREEAPEGSGGLVIGETGTRNITMTAGNIWHGFNQYVIAALNTSGSDRFDSYYRTASTGFTHVTNQSQWPNTQFDNGSGTLATLGNNKYACFWIYLDVSDGSLDGLYGRGEYTSQGLAQAETAPSTIPGHLQYHGKLIGRFIFQKSGTTAIAVESAFSTIFVGGGVTDHGNLSGLGDDDHAQYALLEGRSGSQVLNGGTAASETLTLRSTTNATKGKILFGTSAYDEVNDRLGIGTSSPSVPLHVARSGNPLIFLDDTLGSRAFIQAVGNSDVRFGSASNHNVFFMVNSSPKMQLYTSGILEIKSPGLTYGLLKVFSDGTGTSGEAAIHIGRIAASNDVRWTLGTGSGANPSGVGGVGDDFFLYGGSHYALRIGQNGGVVINDDGTTPVSTAQLYVRHSENNGWSRFGAIPITIGQIGTNYPFVGYNVKPVSGAYQRINIDWSSWIGYVTGGFEFYSGAIGVADSTITPNLLASLAPSGDFSIAGKVLPSTHNTYDLGTTSSRWKDLWLQSGAFNGSDARLKTEVRQFTKNEINAAKEMSKEIGFYKWIESVEKKGDSARTHCGFTVQKAIEIMEKNELNPFDYGFIGYDKWNDKIVHHDEIKAQEKKDDVFNDNGELISKSVGIEKQDAWDEIVIKAGDAYSFRYDQLNLFIARGIEARLSELEEKVNL